jgi:hypothetical protein
MTFLAPDAIRGQAEDITEAARVRAFGVVC